MTTVRSVQTCVYCTVHKILQRTDLIIFPLTLQSIIIAPMMSIWGKGASRAGVNAAMPYDQKSGSGQAGVSALW